MKSQKLIRVSRGLYRTESGIAVFFHSWEKRERAFQRWSAVWTDWMSVEHKVHGETLDSLNRNLACYGIRVSR